MPIIITDFVFNDKADYIAILFSLQLAHSCPGAIMNGNVSVTLFARLASV